MADSFETVRDPTLSVFQSLVDEVARKLAPKNTTVAPTARSSAGPKLRKIAIDIVKRETGQKQTGVAPSTSGVAATSKLCAELALRYVKALAKGDEAAKAAVDADYIGSPCDAAWIETLKEYHAYFGISGQREAQYVRPSTVEKYTIPLKSAAKVALVADWGTGAGPALEVLRAIEEHKPDVLIHLGDIYYSGTPKECEANFLKPVETILRADRTCHVYTLSGNHDMYCGGLGYYGLIAKLNSAPFQQKSSFFCLRSDDASWQFLAMDTGLHDHSPYSVTDAMTWIEDDELSWLTERISEFNGRTILLSHHQLFSAFSSIGPDKGKSRSAVNPKLLKVFKVLSAKGDIPIWFWGHEHSLTIYDEFAGLKRGRCIGHGAIPVSSDEDIYKELIGLPDLPKVTPKTMLSKTDSVWNHGYVILELDGSKCRTSYYQLSSGSEELVHCEVF